ncbi:hypothetical protein ACPDHL_13970 [Myroides sp. C15-4]|uniref:hypothetical protein n=1 Tax=Myroides sp. C15-4 TaxID=3400532 RepID=UPI003D2F7023
MSIGDYLVNLVDRILDFFQLIKDYVDDALRIFEKIKEVVLDIIAYFSEAFEDFTQEASTLFDDTEEDFFFI